MKLLAQLSGWTDLRFPNVYYSPFFSCLCVVYNRYTSCTPVAPFAHNTLIQPSNTHTPTRFATSATFAWSPIKLDSQFFSSNYCFQGLEILRKARGLCTNTSYHSKLFENIRLVIRRSNKKTNHTNCILERV